MRYFWFDLLLTTGAFLAVGFGKGFLAAGLTAVIIVIEISFSFDNAVINAKILARLSRFWQILFLTLGMLIAVVGMRLVFPIFLVSVTAGISWSEVVHIALNDSQGYAGYIDAAHPAIASFGGGFLLMLALSFFFNKNRDVHWLKIEPLMKKMGYWWLPAVVATLILVGLASLPLNTHAVQTLESGLFGVGVYLSIQLLLFSVTRLFKLETKGITNLTGLVALTSFIYLEIIDASFSFDSVIGAFAITSDLVIITVGLAVGTIWVRSLTLFMVRHNTLNQYAFLEHGAHYGVAFLALTILASLVYEIPNFISGGVTVLIIVAAFIASRRHSTKLLLKKRGGFFESNTSHVL